MGLFLGCEAARQHKSFSSCEQNLEDHLQCLCLCAVSLLGLTTVSTAFACVWCDVGWLGAGADVLGVVLHPLPENTARREPLQPDPEPQVGGWELLSDLSTASGQAFT